RLWRLCRSVIDVGRWLHRAGRIRVATRGRVGAQVEEDLTGRRTAVVSSDGDVVPPLVCVGSIAVGQRRERGLRTDRSDVLYDRAARGAEVGRAAEVAFHGVRRVGRLEGAPVDGAGRLPRSIQVRGG